MKDFVVHTTMGGDRTHHPRNVARTAARTRSLEAILGTMARRSRARAGDPRLRNRNLLVGAGVAAAALNRARVKD